MRLESTLRESFERLLLAAIQEVFPSTTGWNGARRWHLSGDRHDFSDSWQPLAAKAGKPFRARPARNRNSSQTEWGFSSSF